MIGDLTVSSSSPMGDLQRSAIYYPPSRLRYTHIFQVLTCSALLHRRFPVLVHFLGWHSLNSWLAFIVHSVAIFWVFIYRHADIFPMLSPLIRCLPVVVSLIVQVEVNMMFRLNLTVSHIERHQ